MNFVFFYEKKAAKFSAVFGYINPPFCSSLDVLISVQLEVVCQSGQSVS